MPSVYNLDGTRMRLMPRDIDGDGKKGGIENVTRGGDIQPINNPAETKEAMKELNEDVIDPNTRMSTIDMKTRLGGTEIMYVLAFDSLVGLGVCPTRSLIITRQKKRLNVSLNGKGREEQVELAVGDKKSREASKGFMSGFTGMGGNANG